MIYTEQLTINGREFTRTLSDLYTVEREGVAGTDAMWSEVEEV